MTHQPATVVPRAQRVLTLSKRLFGKRRDTGVVALLTMGDAKTAHLHDRYGSGAMLISRLRDIKA